MPTGGLQAAAGCQHAASCLLRAHIYVGRPAGRAGAGRGGRRACRTWVRRRGPAGGQGQRVAMAERGGGAAAARTPRCCYGGRSIVGRCNLTLRHAPPAPISTIARGLRGQVVDI